MKKVTKGFLYLSLFVAFFVSCENVYAYTYNDNLCNDSADVRIDNLELIPPEICQPQEACFKLANWGFIFENKYEDVQNLKLSVYIAKNGDVTGSSIWVEVYTLHTDGSNNLYEGAGQSIAILGDTLIGDNNLLEFDLSNITFFHDKKYAVILRTDLLYSSENYYSIFVNCPDDTPVNMSRWFLNDGQYFFSTDVVASFKLYNDENMTPIATSTNASTTEAVYMVGYSIMLVIGFFVALISFFVGFKFVKMFI